MHLTGFLRVFTLVACVALAIPAVSAEKAEKGPPLGPDGKPLPKPKLEDIRVSDVWARAARPGETTHIFFTVENAGPVPVSLRGAETEVAEDVRLVRFKATGPYFHSALVDPIEVPPHGRFRFEPGVAAIELWHVEDELRKGGKLSVRLEFPEVGVIDAEAEIDARSAIRYHEPDPPPAKEGEDGVKKADSAH